MNNSQSHPYLNPMPSLNPYPAPSIAPATTKPSPYTHPNHFSRQQGNRQLNTNPYLNSPQPIVINGYKKGDQQINQRPGTKQIVVDPPPKTLPPLLLPGVTSSRSHLPSGYLNTPISSLNGPSFPVKPNTITRQYTIS